MLETTRSSAFLPGTNVKGQIAGANWMFLRPTLRAEHIVCLGRPSSTTLATLAAFSERVTIVRPGDHPLDAASVDLIVVVGRRHRWRLKFDQQLRRALRASLKPDGLWYYEYHGALSGIFHADGLRRALDPTASVLAFWMTPLAGEVHTAVPVTDRSLAGYFRKDLLSRVTVKTAGGLKGLIRLVSKVGTSEDLERVVGAPAATTRWRYRRAKATGAAKRWLANIGTLADRQPLVARLFGRCGAFVGRSAHLLNTGPPEYLRVIAQRDGVSLDRCRWGLSAPGDYSSRKLLFFLADVHDSIDAARPTYIAKMVRHSALNARLENEYSALCILRDLGIGNRDTVPRPLFQGRHAGLAIVGETAIDGRPLSRRTDHSAGCPWLHAAADFLIHLARRSARLTTSHDWRCALYTLQQRFDELYDLPEAQRSFLHAQTATLSESHAMLPSVFQHGDPGIWNWLANEAGGVALLDWEAAEPRGMPLWDLFYFLRSYCVNAARAGGTRSALAGFDQEFLGATPLGDVVRELTLDYCDAIAMPTDMVGPLLYTCWMHRALKEATRLTPPTLQSGQYFNLLRLCIDKRNSRPMTRLCAPSVFSDATTAAARARRRNATTRSTDSIAATPPVQAPPAPLPNPTGAEGE